MISETYRIDPSLCPHCGTMLSAAASTGPGAPRPGDLTVCLLCGTALTFDDGMKPRALTVGDLEALAKADPETVLALGLMSGLVDEFRRQNPGLFKPDPKKSAN